MSPSRNTLFFVIFINLLTLLYSTPAYAKSRKHKEMWYQVQWCKKYEGKTEVTMTDRTRADCVTNSHAIEFDFANKWKESIGQALNYAFLTGKKAGIVLIVESAKDQQYIADLQNVIQYSGLPIDVWQTSETSLRLLNSPYFPPLFFFIRQFILKKYL